MLTVSDVHFIRPGFRLSYSPFPRDFGLSFKVESVPPRPYHTFLVCEVALTLFRSPSSFMSGLVGK